MPINSMEQNQYKFYSYAKGACYNLITSNEEQAAEDVIPLMLALM